MPVILGITLALCCLFAVVLTAVRLPGTWLIVLGSLGYGWLSDWERIGLMSILVLVRIALLAEAIELAASVVIARRAGASSRAAWGGLIGGIAGMFLLTFLVPIPILGTMVGALVGCFSGAMIAELSVRNQLAQGTRVGLFSALGFVLGTVTKVAIALAMSGILLTLALWPA